MLKTPTISALRALRDHVAAIDVEPRPDTERWARELLALARTALDLVVRERQRPFLAELERHIRVEMITRQERGLGLHIYNREWLKLLDNALAFAPAPRDESFPPGL